MHKKVKDSKPDLKSEPAVSPPDQVPPAASPPSDAAAPKPEPAPLTAPEIEQLKAEAAKAAEHWDRLLRTTADFENFKKRTARERQEAARYANAPLLQKLIPVLDHFDMALAAVNNAPHGSLQSLQAGVAMVHQQLRGALAEAGLEEIDAQGKPFDPRWHEAVSEQPTPDAPEGHVVQQLRKGYKLHDRLLRPASVVVAKKPAPEPPTATSPAETAAGKAED